MSKEEIFHNKLVHYNPAKFPNGMKKCIYNAMQEYSDQQNKLIQEQFEDLKRQNLELQEKLGLTEIELNHKNTLLESCEKALTETHEKLDEANEVLKASEKNYVGRCSALEKQLAEKEFNDDVELLNFIDWFGSWQEDKHLPNYGINDILKAYKLNTK